MSESTTITLYCNAIRQEQKTQSGCPEISRRGVRFDKTIGEDEIDLESGFLMMPQAVPVAIPAAAAPGGTIVTPTPPDAAPPLILTPPSGTPGASPTDGAGPGKRVEFSFSADRNQLFSAWNAIANLADLAGKVNVTVRADSAAGFDKGKLQNGVLEPLRESDLVE